VPLTSREGARRFASLLPGQRISITLRRSGVDRTATLTADRWPATIPASSIADSLSQKHGVPGAASARILADSSVRFSGGIGGLQVEVRGSPEVTVLLDENRCGGVIITERNRITLSCPVRRR
jgi:hypothetical protein